MVNPSNQYAMNKDVLVTNRVIAHMEGWTYDKIISQSEDYLLKSILGFVGILPLIFCLNMYELECSQQGNCNFSASISIQISRIPTQPRIFTIVIQPNLP